MSKDLSELTVERNRRKICRKNMSKEKCRKICRKIMSKEMSKDLSELTVERKMSKDKKCRNVANNGQD